MGFLEGFFRKRQPSADTGWQTPIAKEIGTAIVGIIPADWVSAYIVLESPEEGVGSGLNHSAITRHAPTGFELTDDQFITPDWTVFAATRQLELEWAARNLAVRRFTFCVFRQGDGWAAEGKYEYAD